MISLLLAAAASAAPSHPEPIWRCTAQHYSAQVSPSGTTAKWPVVAALPKQLRDEPTMLLASPGMVPGGQAHVMVVDAAANKVYIVQSGGTPNAQKVFGPLPAVDCTPGANSGPAAPR